MNQSGKIIIAVLSIVSIAGFSILLASDKGAKTRKKISKKGKELWEKTKETASDLADEASNLTNKLVKEGENLL